MQVMPLVFPKTLVGFKSLQVGSLIATLLSKIGSTLAVTVEYCRGNEHVLFTAPMEVSDLYVSFHSNRVAR